jgi:hypothetical protein
LYTSTAAIAAALHFSMQILADWGRPFGIDWSWIANEIARAVSPGKLENLLDCVRAVRFIINANHGAM